MDAGKLDRRITLRRATYARDASNAKVPTWADLITVWANYTPVSDGEKFSSGQVNAAISGRFVIRYSSEVSTVNPTDQLVFDGHTYNILNVKETARRQWLEITAAARGDGS